MPDWLNDTIAWWNALAPEWAFLFALPFLVAAAALVVHGGRKPQGEERRRESPGRARRPERHRPAKPTPRPH